MEFRRVRFRSYDGKGQARIMKPEDADAAWTLIAEQPTILEGFVRFDREFSVILARTDDGEGRFWACPDNVHRDRSEEHTSELQSLMRISYAVFCLTKKTRKHTSTSAYR